MHTDDRRRRRGANAVEFALLAPVLILIFTGMIDYGWYFFQQQSVVAAARVGARAGSVTLQGANPTVRAEQVTLDALAGGGVDPSSATVSSTLVGAWPDQVIEVAVQVPYSGFFGLLPLPDALATDVVMLMEDQPEA